MLKHFIGLIIVFGLLSLGGAQTYYKLPEHLSVFQNDGILINQGATALTFIPGIGWIDKQMLSQPLVIGQQVYVQADILEHLGIHLPRIDAIRFGGDTTTRIVLDLSNVTDSYPYQRLEQQGQLEENQSLVLPLGNMLIPFDAPDSFGNLQLELQHRPETSLRISGPAISYRVFYLENPSRLVIDTLIQSTATITAETRILRPGMTYQRFASPSSLGFSGVHLLEIAPGTGEFRVIGSNNSLEKVSVLANGAFAAINASYFDAGSQSTIGFLKIDHGLLSLPSRNRASIAFSSTPIIDRVTAIFNITVNGKLFRSDSSDTEPKIRVYTDSGQLVGSPGKGVITVQHGLVTANKIGPQRVPENGFAIVYEPDERALALVDSGNFASLEIRMYPEAFMYSRYVVEAGPLLVKEGQAAFVPELEQFRRGERILDDSTQQAAIGIRADGTVLLLTADAMTAEDLVPLMLSLGAQDAMRLDSGGSTTLYIDGTVINRKSERHVASIIAFIPY